MRYHAPKFDGEKTSVPVNSVCSFLFNFCKLNFSMISPFVLVDKLIIPQIFQFVNFFLKKVLFFFVVIY